MGPAAAFAKQPAAAAPAVSAAPPPRVTVDRGLRWPPPALSQLVESPPRELTWSLASLTLAAGVGWIYERRRRRLLEMERDSVMWSSVRDPTGTAPSRPEREEILPESPPPDESVRSVYASAIGDTRSRREATLIDLHEMDDVLRQMLEQRDMTGATELLEQHLVDFRYTSPWVFLELRELYRQLERQGEWELARDAFRARFGQNAPHWGAPSTAHDELANDKQLGPEIVRKWPHRESRMLILRWMLGDAESRRKNFGPPQLTLGIYRDMMLLDAMLDEVMQARAARSSTAA